MATVIRFDCLETRDPFRRKCGTCPVVLARVETRLSALAVRRASSKYSVPGRHFRHLLHLQHNFRERTGRLIRHLSTALQPYSTVIVAI